MKRWKFQVCQQQGHLTLELKNALAFKINRLKRRFEKDTKSNRTIATMWNRFEFDWNKEENLLRNNEQLHEYDNIKFLKYFEPSREGEEGYYKAILANGTELDINTSWVTSVFHPAVWKAVVLHRKNDGFIPIKGNNLARYKDKEIARIKWRPPRLARKTRKKTIWDIEISENGKTTTSSCMTLDEILDLAPTSTMEKLRNDKKKEQGVWHRLHEPLRLMEVGVITAYRWRWGNERYEEPKEGSFIGSSWDEERSTFSTFEELSEDWVLKEFGEEKVATWKQMGEKGRSWYPIPIGNSVSETTLISEEIVDGNKMPRIEYNQGTKNTCIFDSAASALHYLGYERVARIIHIEGQTNIMTMDAGKMDCLVQLMREHCGTMIASKMEPKREDGFEFLCASDMLTVVPRGDDGNTSHAVTVVDSMIFDSNYTNALPFCKESMDKICSTKQFSRKFCGIHCGYRFSRNNTMVKHPTVKTENGDVMPTLKYRLLTEQTCIFNSLASALYFLGLTDEANQIYDGKREATKNVKQCAKIVRTNMNKTCKFMKQGKIAEGTNFEELYLSSSLQWNLKLIAPRCKTGGTGYPVVIVRNFIFDCHYKYALPLERASMDMICQNSTRQSNFANIQWGVVFEEYETAKTKKLYHPKLNYS